MTYDFIFFSVINSDRLISLISTDTNTMLIFEITSLKWAAQLPFTPLTIKRGTFSVSKKKLVRRNFILFRKKNPIQSIFHKCIYVYYRMARM